jgi:hypothetical protein
MCLRHYISRMISEIIMAATTQITVGWDVEPCSLVDRNRGFEGKSCLHIHEIGVTQVWKYWFGYMVIYENRRFDPSILTQYVQILERSSFPVNRQRNADVYKFSQVGQPFWYSVVVQ